MSTRTSRMHLRGLGSLCSSAVCNQGKPTLIFNTISCGLQSQAANNRVIPRHIIDYRKKQTRTLRMSENINFTNDDVMKYVIWTLQWKLPRAPLPFNPALTAPMILRYDACFFWASRAPNSESKRGGADPTLQGLLITTKSCIVFCEKLQRLPSLSPVCYYTFYSKFSERIFGNVMSVAIPQIDCPWLPNVFPKKHIFLACHVISLSQFVLCIIGYLEKIWKNVSQSECGTNGAKTRVS